MAPPTMANDADRSVPPGRWQAIARLAMQLTALPDMDGRIKRLQAFCKDVWDVPEATFISIGRNLADMETRPARGPGAFWEQMGRLAGPKVLTGEEIGQLSVSPELPALVTDPRWQSFLIAPVTTPGRVVGVLVLAKERSRFFDHGDVDMLDAVLPQVATVIDSSLLAAENRYKEAYSRALGDIDMMIASYDVAEILRHGVRKILETIAAEKVMVFIVNPDTGDVRLSVSEGCIYARDDKIMAKPCALLAIQALRERRSQMVGAQEIRALVTDPAPTGCDEQQAIVTPIMANNQVYGVLEVIDKRDGRPFHRNEVAFINQVALKLALVIQNTHAYLTINRLNESLENKVRDRTSQLEKAITTLQATQAQLMQSEKLATIGTLAGGVAHELNNPLAAILANVQLLRLDVVDDEHKDSLSLIEIGARRCKHIIENLMNHARVSSAEHRSLSVSAILEETLALLNHQVRHARMELSVEADEVPPVIGIATEIGQIFTNLMINAMDAIAERHPAPNRGRLAIRIYAEGKCVVTEFKDDGKGIEEHLVRKVFDPFFTTKPVGKGTGLGLSVSQQLAATFGGHIEAKSSIGVGSAFRLVLPMAHGTGPLIAPAKMVLRPVEE